MQQQQQQHARLTGLRSSQQANTHARTDILMHPLLAFLHHISTHAPGLVTAVSSTRPSAVSTLCQAVPLTVGEVSRCRWGILGFQLQSLSHASVGGVCCSLVTACVSDV